MNGKERVRRAVLFQRPDRVPRDLPDPWGSDFLILDAEPDPNFTPSREGEDEWGCVWQKDPIGKTMGQVKLHPLNDYRLLKDFPFPCYDLPSRYKKPERMIRENREEKFVLADIPLSLIHRLEYLRGHVEAWTDPYERPDELRILLDRMADIALDAVEHFARIGADGIYSCDDWGLQDRPMVSPEIFREFFKPRYKRVYSAAHQSGMLNFLHSCGHIFELLDDFIDAGLDVIQMDQQENMGVEKLSRRFGGRLCFWCPVDIQQTMVKGTVQEIRCYAKKLIESFGSFNGGFISMWYKAPEAINHSWEKVAAMSDAFVEYGNCY